MNEQPDAPPDAPGASPLPGEPRIGKGSGGFLGNVLALGGSTALAQALAVALAPVISRLFSPEAFGSFSVFNSIAMGGAMFGCFAYHLAVVLPKRDEEAANLLWLCVGLIVAVTALAAAALAAVGEPLLKLLDAPDLVGIMYLIPVGVFCVSIHMPLQLWNSRHKHFKRLAVVTMAMRLSGLAAVLTLGFLGLRSGRNLVCGRLIGVVAGPVLLGWFWWRHDRAFAVRHFDLAQIRRLAKRYRKFPLLNSWAIFANHASILLPPVILAAAFGKAMAGQYTNAMALMGLPLTLVSASVGRVFYERAAAARKADQPLGRLLESVATRLITLGLLPVLIVALIGPEAFGLILGARWQPAGLIASILSIRIFFMFVNSPISMLFVVLERQGIHLILMMVLFVSATGALAFGGFVLEDPFWAVLAFSCVSAAVTAVRIAVLLRLTGARPAVLLTHLTAHLGYAAPGAVLLAALKWGLRAGPLLLVIVAAVLAVLYTALALRRDTELRAMLLRRRARR